MYRLRLASLALVLLATASCSSSNSTTPTAATPTTATRIINITGDLAFGNVNVGESASRTYTISNSGNAALTLTGLQAAGGTGNAGFTATLLTGTIGPGSSSTGQLRFSPTAAQGYSHVLTVVGDQTSGNAAINVSGVGVGTSSTPAPVPAPGPTPSTFTIGGTVTDGFSGAALTRTQVQITAGTNSGQATGTDGSGNYTLANLSAGTFTLAVSSTGYTTASKQVVLPGTTRIDFVLPRVASTPAPAPTPTPPPTTHNPNDRVGAVCSDGSLSSATGSGACSSHGGVRCWRYPDGSCTNP